MGSISRTAETINSREIIERIAEIEDSLPGTHWELKYRLAATSEELRDEYTSLIELQEQGQSIAADWEYGETLIHVDYFAEYQKELIQELGYLPDNMPDWLMNNIDWDGVAQDLEVDYTQIDFDGESYWIH